MMKEKSVVQIVPAFAGTFAVYDDAYGRTVLVGETIIAWRTETSVLDNGEYHTSCFPLCADGEACSNCIGVMVPSGMIEEFDGGMYRSIEELQEHKYPVDILTGK